MITHLQRSALMVVCCLALASWASPAPTVENPSSGAPTPAGALTHAGALMHAGLPAAAGVQRPGRGGAGAGQQALDPAHVLENFADIVEMIWTEEEEEAWDRLRSDEERQAYIVAFWEDRDPTPDTEVNEFRDLYMARVQDAYNRFSGEGEAGYRTDRGQVLIIYGGAITLQEIRQVGTTAVAPPSNPFRETDPTPEGGEGPRTQRLVWTMDTSMNPYLEGKDNIVFTQRMRTFNRNTSGIELSQEAFLANRDVQDYFAGRIASVGVAAAAPAAEMPPDVAAMRDLLTEGTVRDELDLSGEISFFPSPEKTYTVVTFSVAKDKLTFEGGEASLKAFGVLRLREAAQEQTLRQMRLDFDVDRDEGSDERTRTHSFSMTLEPGDYRLAWGVIDDGSSQLSTTSRPFTVPDFASDELMLSSIILARPPVQQRSDAIDINIVYSGMRIANVELDVDIDRMFDDDDIVEVLYFVGGAGTDPDTGQVELMLDLFVKDANGQALARLPTEISDHTAIEQQIPLEQIEGIEPGGSYVAEIMVRDLIGGQQIVGTAPFHVAEG